MRISLWDRAFIAGMALVALLAAATVIGPLVYPNDPVFGDAEPFLAPSIQHLFGTDNLGRDVFVRAMVALRLDVALSVTAVCLSVVIGTTVGSLMGVWKDSVLSKALVLIIDSVNAFPFMVLALGIVAVVGPSPAGVVAAIVLTGWARYARMARTQSVVVASQDFISATRILGYRRWRIVARHVFPNVFPESFAFALAELVVIILMIASLSFLGAGVRPPTPELGAMIAEGRAYIANAWWVIVLPGLVLALTALAVQFVAEGYERMRRDS